ncbi:hypothetical protein BZG35_08390 [Brevundimonas sp. LM2]|uniref:ATP-binding cassette domain-containing protein n=1 Tax=Brevundimonas sp. LM2 TaxID=1938605 RepID=UPI000983F5C0|nr:ATP-binding cassette domain-containing protein [Brevundimonas sp. LM2]AQR61667.1 hypothetical protein BZG35_08390 [Brevundimonas sp. LM2]
MADAKTIRIDPKDYRLDGRLAKRIWRLSKPYWTDPRHWKSWVLMVFTIAVGPAWAYVGYWTAQKNADQVNALVATDQSVFLSLFWLLFWLGVGQWVYQQLLSLLTQLMTMQWFRWMTEWMVNRYLEHKTYYDITLNEDIDNPDERIESNVKPFIDSMLSVPGRILGSVLGVATNAVLLTQVSSAMTGFVVIYSMITMGIQVLIYIPLIRMNFEQVAANADLRYGLLRVRDHAETIAFFRGERTESRQVVSRLWRLVNIQMKIFYYTLWTGGLSQALSYVWALAPLFLVYPLYFSGQIAYGTITLATAAASNLMGALTQLNQYLPFIANLAPVTVRLAQLVERWDMLAERNKGNTPGLITLREGREGLRLEGVTFTTPGGQSPLVKDLTFDMGAGRSLIVIGQTGVGKSSLLRVMAGLWRQGSGTIILPPEADTMFVPQRPYMMLGDLRAQLLYPHGDPKLSDAELQAVLEQVRLPDLIQKCGGLDAERDWIKVLSLGEQQRISFARVLISKPSFVVLDEATSALDIPTEAAVYQALGDSGCAYVSVGHRETILRFHERALRLMPQGAWELVDPQSLPLTEIAPLASARPARPDAVEAPVALTAGRAPATDLALAERQPLVTDLDTTAPLTVSRFAADLAGRRLDVAAAQIQGERDDQEDSVLIQPLPGDALLIAVSDGMGGHPDGEVASALGLATLRQAVLALSDQVSTAAGWSAALHAAVIQATTAVRLLGDASGLGMKAAKEDPGPKTPGATLAAVILVPSQDVWVYAAAGDSWIYKLNGQRGGKRINTLHTGARKHTITSFLGLKTPQVEGTDLVLPLKGVTGLVLATDGVDVLTLRDVEAAVRAASDAPDAAADILARVTAKAHPKQDNASVIVVRLSASA